MCSRPARKPRAGQVHFLSLGCDKNLVDTEKFLACFKAAGFEPKLGGGRGDIIFINTCAFIDAAKEESIEHILDAVRQKKAGRLKLIIVGGCLVELNRRELEKELPEVDLWLSFSEIERLLTGAPAWQRFRTTPRHISYLKIAEGCNRGCSFCIIPKIRGRFRSAPEAKLLAEARLLEASGVKELNLVAQDLCAYGKDTGTNLEQLLERLLSQTSIPWFRLFYLNPEGITTGLLKLMAREKRICRYIDFPFQHISDRVLKNMGRRVREKQIRSLIDKMRAIIPGLAIRGTALVGFPGESETDFRRLARFVEDAHFDWLGVFAYSPQQDTRAFGMKGRVPTATAARRKEQLENLWRVWAEEKLRSRIDKKVKIIVDSKSDREFDYQGRSQASAYEIDGVIQLRGKFRPGEFCTVRIEDCLGLDLLGVKINARRSVK